MNPSIYKKTGQSLVRKLNPAPAWFGEIDGSLPEIVFKPTLYDSCVYIFNQTRSSKMEEKSEEDVVKC